MTKNKLKLTPEEEWLILQRRKSEEAKKPKKIGFLKEDMYEFNPPPGKFGLWNFFTFSETNSLIKEFKECFKKTLLAGSKFICYIENGKESWYDCDNFGYERLNSDWAKENLINVRPYRKLKK